MQKKGRHLRMHGGGSGSISGAARVHTHRAGGWGVRRRGCEPGRAGQGASKGQGQRLSNADKATVSGASRDSNV